ncbi:hypothetical protein FRC08_006330 [Ceratobasidium sp. 394]|nr:hypothetical protein FRC08_006330 [Ceratobasidium sp. 394]
MTDNPSDSKGGGNTVPGDPRRTLGRSNSTSSINSRKRPFSCDSPFSSPRSSRPGSPSDGPRPTKSRRSSFAGHEDLDDPIGSYSQPSLVAGGDPSHSNGVLLTWTGGVTPEPEAIDADATDDEDEDTVTQRTRVATSVQGEKSNTGDPHVPAAGTPATETPAPRPPSRPISPPSASMEAAMDTYMTQPTRAPTQAIFDFTASRAQSPEVAHILVPGTPPSQPPSRSVSQVSTLPDEIRHVPLVHGGRENVTPNTILASIVKAGGKAQDSMRQGPSVPHALRIVGNLLADSAGALEQIADATIASGDRQVYQQMAMARCEYRSMIYSVLRDLDRITVRDQEANLPAEDLPTDTLAVLRAINDFRESMELDLAAFKFEMRDEMEKLKAGRVPTPVAKETQPSKPTPPSRRSAPKPPLNPKAPEPAPRPARDEPTNTGWDPTSGPGEMDWNAHIAAETESGPRVREPTDEAHKALLENLRAGLPDAEGDAQPRPDDGFQAVSRKSKAKAKVSYAKVAAKAPAPPVVDASKVASAIRTAGKQQVPSVYTVHFPEGAPGPGFAERLPSHHMYKVVNDALARTKTSLRILQVAWNKKGNLVFHFPHATGLGEVEQVIPTIQKALGLPANSEFKRCTPWSKVVFSRVPTGLDMGNGVRYSSDELREELYRCNPIMNMVEVTQQPRWIAREVNMANKRFSSFTLAFEDNHDGKTLAALTGAHLMMFGVTLKVSKWTEKPLLKECERCHAYDHFLSECRSGSPICALCSGRHKTIDHRAACALCKKENRAPSMACVHPYKCARCGGPHGAKDPRCPHRSRYRLPVTKVLAQNEAARAEAEVEADDE